MSSRGTWFKAAAALLIVIAAVLGVQAVINPRTERTVVVYTSVDQSSPSPC